MIKKGYKTLTGLLLAVLVNILVFCISNDIAYASSFTQYESNGVIYFFVDDQQVTEEEYYDAYYDGTYKTGYITLTDGSLRWYYYGEHMENENAYWEKVAQGWGYSYIGELGTKLDGTVLWYGANKIYYSENDAINGYVIDDCASGGYKKSDGTYVWFWDGVILANKDTYVKKVASYYGQGYRSIDDGTILYYYNGIPYYTEREYYEAKGYVYIETEAEGIAEVDKWFNADSNLTQIGFWIKGIPSVEAYYDAKLESATGDALYLTYRESIMKSRRDTSGGNSEDIYIGIEISTDQFGTEAQIKAARIEAKKVADTLRNKSQYEQMKGAYDWICNNIQYDYSLNNHSAYSAFVTKKTVCEGYTAAFQLIMEELGIECHTVSNSNHTWNVVKFEGKWYWVDATWGDQESYVDYTWFLCGTNARGNITTLNVSPTAYSNGNGTPPPVQTEPTTTQKETTEETTEESTEETVEEVTTEEESIKEVVTDNTNEIVTEKETESGTEKVTEDYAETESEVSTEKLKDKNPKKVIIVVSSIAACLVIGFGVSLIIIKNKKKG